MSDKLKVSFTNTKIKTQDRSKGRMKISLKLSKEEAEAFKTFMVAIKPEEVAEEDFYKQIFFMGCRSLDDQLRQMFEENKAKLEAQKAEAIATPETHVEEPKQ
jgi:benzoyl-CoA reductase/2-hydroxyglutaryl-CoA dehydratase subunit BcrC/BadD/HgdB